MATGRIGDGGAAEAARQAEAARRAAEAARQAAEAAARKLAEAATRQTSVASAAPGGQSSFEPAATKNPLSLDGQGAPAPASSLFTEDARDGSVNCLDQAADWLNKTSPALRGRSEMVFLADSRGGAEGQAGHVVVRQGERVLDPSSGKSYENMQAYLKEQPHYSEVGSMSGTAAAKVFSTEPGSPERAQALADAKVSPELQKMMVADPAIPGEAPDVNNPPHDVTTGPIPVKVPGQATEASIELSDTLEKDVVQKDGYTTVTLTAEMKATASGSLEMGRVTVGGGVSTGTSQTYEVKMKDEDFEKLKRGELPPPHPLKPDTIPDQCSVTMESSELKGWSGEASLGSLKRELGITVGEEQTRSKGLSIQTERDGDKVQVTAGPTDVLEKGLSVTVGGDHAGVTLTGNESVSNYKLRTAEFDLANPEGKAAYDTFVATGEMPFTDGNGVSGAAKIEKLELSGSSELEGKLGPWKGSVEVSGESTGTWTSTTWPDGSKDHLVEYNPDGGSELYFKRHIDAQGNEDPSKQEFSLFLKGLEGGSEEAYAQAFQVDQHLFDGANDIHMSFTADQLMQLKDRARGFAEGQAKLAGGKWDPTNQDYVIIKKLSEAQTPADVANVLATYTNERGVVGEALAKLTMTPNGEAAIPGTVEARNRDA
ncbi:hypothetical protein [Pyxidicoccus trucidator]|uniref:hypothetical protein n=1 Tax=Pyxidicoccus trucidator TaxID=2709662 RepID=UPI0013DAC1CC|nr:hypothetical protein [Pyxidicoccus trucidator]